MISEQPSPTAAMISDWLDKNLRTWDAFFSSKDRCRLKASRVKSICAWITASKSLLSQKPMLQKKTGETYNRTNINHLMSGSFRFIHIAPVSTSQIWMALQGYTQIEGIYSCRTAWSYVRTSPKTPQFSTPWPLSAGTKIKRSVQMLEMPLRHDIQIHKSTVNDPRMLDFYSHISQIATWSRRMQNLKIRYTNLRI